MTSLCLFVFMCRGRTLSSWPSSTTLTKSWIRWPLSWTASTAGKTLRDVHYWSTSSDLVRSAGRKRCAQRHHLTTPFISRGIHFRLSELALIFHSFIINNARKEPLSGAKLLLFILAIKISLSNVLSVEMIGGQIHSSRVVYLKLFWSLQAHPLNESLPWIWLLVTKSFVCSTSHSHNHLNGPWVGLGAKTDPY